MDYLTNNAFRKWGIGAMTLIALVVLSCNLSDENGNTFIHVETDSTWAAYDSLQIEWRDNVTGEHRLLFHGQPSKLDSLNKLPANGYQGQKIDIIVRCFSGITLVHEEIRHFDGKDARLITIDTSIYKSMVYKPIVEVPVLKPAIVISIAARDTQVTEGDSVPLPMVTVTPESVLDKSITWFSTDLQRVTVQRGRYFALRPGITQLWARLKSDSTKQMGFVIEVVGRKTILRIDSLRLSPDTLPLALKGSPGRFTVQVYPPSLECPFIWSHLDSSIAQITPSGVVAGIREGRGRIRISIACRDADTLSDTAWVAVTGPIKVDSLRFQLDSLDLFVGGLRESLSIIAYPPLANQEFDITVQNALIADWNQAKLKGLKAGRTIAIARSKQDSLKIDTLRLNVIAPQPIDSVVVLDSVLLFTGGESPNIKAKVYPAKYSQEVLWRSLAPAIAKIDGSGKAMPVKPGRTYLLAISRVDSTRRDSTLVIVRKDTPLLALGGDTTLALGASLVFAPKVYQEYGRIVRFKWDLDGDGFWDDSVATIDSLKSQLTYRYDQEQEIQTRFYIRDSEGNDTLVFKKVKTVKGPVILILAPADQCDTNQTVIDVSWSVDGVLQTTFNKEPLSVGPNIVTRKYKDASGKEFSTAITIFLDTVPPGKPQLHSTNPVNTQLPTWTWSSGGGGNGRFRYRLDDQDMNGATQIIDTVFTPAKTLSEDVHTLFVQEQDGAGNWSVVTRLAVKIDLTPPLPPKVLSTQTSPSNEAKPNWTWTSGGGDGMGVYRFKLDNSDLTRGTTQGTETAFRSADSLGSGEHILYVQERDSAGNWSQSGSVKVLVDRVAPVAPKVFVSPNGSTNIPRPTWTWMSGDGNGKFRYRLDSTDLAIGALTEKSLTFTPDHDLTTGRHVLYVQESDSAGNWSPSGSAEVIIDLLKPNAPKVSFSPTSPMRISQPKWTWITGGNGGSGIFRYGVEAGASTRLNEGSASEFIPESDLPNGEVIFYVQEKDSVGNWSDTTVTRLWIDLVKPGAPVISYLPQSPLNSLRPTWTWASGGNGGMGVYRCKLNDSHLESSSIEVSNAQFTPDQDLAEGLHTLYVQERDSAGNWSDSATKITRISLSKIVGNGALASARGDYNSMVMYGGTPYVAFSDYSQNLKSTVMRLLPDKSGWEPVGGVGFTSGVAYQLAFAISPAGRPYIAFQDVKFSNRVTVMRLNAYGNGWEIYGGGGFSQGYAQHISMAIDAAGVPFVCYMDDSQGNKLTVMKANATGTGWIPVANRNFSPEAASNPSMALNSAGIPYVSFTNGILSASGVVMKPNAAGTNWETVGGSSFSPGNAYSSHMIFSNAGVPHVAFSDGTNSGSVTLRKLNSTGTAWETVGEAGISSPWCHNFGIVFDSLDLPYVAYTDGNAMNRATMKHLNAAKTGWEIVGKAGFTAGEATDISLAIDGNGVPYMAYGDGGDGLRPTVMKISFDP